MGIFNNNTKRVPVSQPGIDVTNNFVLDRSFPGGKGGVKDQIAGWWGLSNCWSRTAVLGNLSRMGVRQKIVGVWLRKPASLPVFGLWCGSQINKRGKNHSPFLFCFGRRL
jgi:hypothetical protein